MALLLCSGINALIGYALGKPKNEVGPSIPICILLGPIGWLLCILNKGKLRKCPYCAEDIKPEAVVCRHCGRDLPQIPFREPGRDFWVALRDQIHPKRNRQHAIALLLVGLVLLGGMLLYAAMHKQPIPATNTALSQLREDTQWAQLKPKAITTTSTPTPIEVRRATCDEGGRPMKHKTRPSVAIAYTKHRSRSHDSVIRVYDEAGNVIETHEHKGDFKEW